MSHKPQVFISHSSADAKEAIRLAVELRNRGVGVWIDGERIKYGQSIPEAIEKGLDESDCVLVLVSHAFLASKWCRAEYEPLLMRELDSDAIFVVPVLLEDCELPLLLARKRYFDLRIREGELLSWWPGVAELAEQLKAHPRKHDAKPPAALPGLHETASPTQRLRGLLNAADADVLLNKSGTRSDREAARDLLEEVTTLIEHFEEQYDELISVLTESGFQHSLSASAGGVSRNRLMRANRKLITTSNEMRAIYERIRSQFALAPDLAESLDSVTDCCRQIAVRESFLVIEGVKNSGDLKFDTQRQEEMLDWRRADGDVVEWGDVSSDSGGRSLVDDYHHILIELNDYKIRLKEAIRDLCRE